MTRHRLKIVHNREARTITLKITFWRAGWRERTQQITFSDRVFMSALREADIIQSGSVIP